eukprot:1158426-Pelagomonas_calceolata.AAC.22
MKEKKTYVGSALPTSTLPTSIKERPTMLLFLDNVGEYVFWLKPLAAFALPLFDYLLQAE